MPCSFAGCGGTGWHAAELLEPADGSLDAVTQPVFGRVEGAGARHAGALRDDWLRTDGLDEIEDCVGVVGLLSARMWPVGRPVSKGMPNLGSLALPPVRMKRTGRPKVSTAMCHLEVKPPLERPKAWSQTPLFGRWRPGRERGRSSCRSSNTHCRGAGEVREDTLPNPSPRPTGEAFVHRLILAVALRQVRPARP